MRDRQLWTWHIAAGLVIFVLLGLHMAIMHLDDLAGLFNPAGGHAIDWDNVTSRGRSLGFTGTYILLLGVGLFHGLYGLRNILLELSAAPFWRRAVGWALPLLGVALFVFGSWAAWASHVVSLGEG